MPNKDDTPYTGEARLVPEDNRWHLKKEVNLTIIISVIGATGTAQAARIEALEVRP